MDLDVIEGRLKDLVKISRRNKKRQELFNSLVKRYGEYYERVGFKYFARLFGIMERSSSRITHYQKKIAWRLHQYLKNCPHTEFRNDPSLVVPKGARCHTGGRNIVIFKSSPLRGEPKAKIAKSNNDEDSLFNRLMELRESGHKVAIEFEGYREGWGNEAKKDYRAWVKDYTPEPIPHGEPNGNGGIESLRDIFGDTIILRNGTTPNSRVKEPVGELDWRYVKVAGE